MTTHEERIDNMIATGRVSREEGERLRAAIDPEQAPAKRWTKVLDPVAHLPTGVALIASGAFAAFGVVLGTTLGIRFDGALDAHVGGPPVAMGTAVIEQLLAWPLMAAIAYAAARLAGAKSGTRPVDMLSAVGVARLPLALSGVLSLLLMPKLPADPDAAIKALTEGSGLIRTLLVAGLTLPLIVLFFVLLVRGYRTASGLSGSRLAISAIGFILVAEVVSKLVLMAL